MEMSLSSIASNTKFNNWGWYYNDLTRAAIEKSATFCQHNMKNVLESHLGHGKMQLDLTENKNWETSIDENNRIWVREKAWWWWHWGCEHQPSVNYRTERLHNDLSFIKNVVDTLKTLNDIALSQAS